MGGSKHIKAHDGMMRDSSMSEEKRQNKFCQATLKTDEEIYSPLATPFDAAGLE